MKTFLHLLLATLLGLASLGAISTPATAQTASLTSQSIKFGVNPSRYNISYGTPYTLTATATSGLPVTFSIVAGPATVNGNILTLTGTGSVTVEANQAGDATYAPARKVTRFFYAYRGFQYLTPFETIPDQVYGDTPFSINIPVSNADLPVTVAVVSGPATIQGDTITLTGVGIVKLKASQPGNALYSPTTTPVTTSFNVTALPVITSVKTVQGTVGKPFSYQITSTGTPTSYTLAGTLPLGLNFDSTTGLISGIPAKTTSTNLTIGASATEGTGTAKLHVAIIANVPHLFVSNQATGTVAEYTTTGTLVNASLIRGLSGPGLAIADGFLYAVGQSGSVAKYKTSGELVTLHLTPSSIGYATSVAVHGTNLFVGYFGGIGAYTTSGETLNPTLVKGLKNNYGLAATDAGIFVSSMFNGNITQYSATGVRIQNSLVKGLGGPTGVAVTDTNIYVLNNDIGTIGKYTLAGKPVNPVLVTGLVQPQGIAVLGDTIFVTGGNNTVSTYSTTGSTLNPFFIVGLHTPIGIAIEP